MKQLFVLVFLLAGFSAQAEDSIVTCASKVEMSLQEIGVAKDRFSVGEVSRVDVNGATYASLNQRFDCRDILFKDYCDIAVPLIDELTRGVKEEITAGLRPALELLAAQKEKILVDARCPAGR